MSGDISAEVWLNSYRWDALEEALDAQGTCIEKHLQNYLIDLYAELVPRDQQLKIEQKLEMERLADARSTLARRRFSVYRMLDRQHLDRIQAMTATAREFLIVVRPDYGKNAKESEVRAYLSRLERSLREQGFIARLGTAEDYKRILAIYMEQNVTTEQFEDHDGTRWIILND